MIYYHLNQEQNASSGLAAAFNAASMTGQGNQKNAASSLENAASVKQLTTGHAGRLILKPSNKQLLFDGLVIMETKKADKTALKLVINNKPAVAGFSSASFSAAGLIWLIAGNGNRQASQQPASSRSQVPAASGTDSAARKSLKVAESRSKSLAQKVATKVAKSLGSQSR